MSEQMNREALENYLSNLFVLECLKKKTEEKKWRFEGEQNEFRWNVGKLQKSYPNYNITQPDSFIVSLIELLIGAVFLEL